MSDDDELEVELEARLEEQEEFEPPESFVEQANVATGVPEVLVGLE